MRLRRLDLTRYGRFTDAVLDFGPRGGGPDLHVVYGPNEAGKSTALSGYLDLLYGIHPQSPYAFLHDYRTMRIGAVLEDATGRAETFVRVKANRNSLLDDHGQPVGDHVLGPRLGGIDRAAYRAMFSLDDDTLEQGGEDILRNEGDLGQLLFAASAGLSDLAATLDDLSDKADRFTRKGARKTDLAEMKADLETLRRERDAIDVRAADHARLVKARDQAAGEHDQAAQALGAARARREEIARLRDGLSRLVTIRRLRAELEAFAGLPEPPLEWIEEISGLRDEDTGLTTRHGLLERDIAGLEDALGAIQVDADMLACGDRLDRLRRDPESRYRAAVPDLPRVRDECRDIETRLADLTRRLGQPADRDPWTLCLPAANARALRDLIGQRSGVEGGLGAARVEHRKAAERLAAAQADLVRVTGPAAAGGVGAPDARPGSESASDPGSDSGTESAWHLLDAALRASSRDDAEARWLLETRDRAALADAEGAALAALAPWSGDGASLAAMAIPDASRLDAWRAALAEADAGLRDERREINRLEQERASLVARAEALRGAGGVVDDARSAALRAARDVAWSGHRAVLDAATADAFAAALRADDAAADARLAGSADLARLRQTDVEAAAMAGALDQVRNRHEATRAARADQVADVVAVLAALGLPPDWSVDSLTDWLSRRQAALRAGEARRDKDRRIAAAREDAERGRAALVSALAGVDVVAAPDAGMAALRETAETVLKARSDRVARLRGAREAVAAATRDAQERARALEDAVEAQSRWRAAWEQALADGWLGTAAPVPAPEAVDGILDDLATLEGLLMERDALVRRIDGMVRDQASYVAALSDLLVAVGETPAPERPLDAADALAGRLKAARLAEDRRADLRRRLDEARQARATLAAPLAALARRKAEMTALFGVKTLAEVAAALHRVEQRARLRERLSQAEAALGDAVREPDAARAETALAAVDVESLDLEAAELDSRLPDLDARRLDQFAALTRARDALAGIQGDDDVARLEERRRTLLLEIEDRARHHLHLRLGVAAARRALTLYRERHRSAMLARAGEAFTTISRGAYDGLGTQPGVAGERLVAREAGGGSKTVDALSKGTRFQLYLALRVAGYHEIAGRADPVPFVADDIMETFDDDRAEEAMRLFADMATVGQVIYMTHHRHLVETARAVCPGARVHGLDGAAAPA